MHALKVDYIWNRKKPYLHLYSLGDVHAGAAGCDIERLDTDIDTIRRDPLARVILTGDLADCIKRSDKRFDPRAIWGWLNERNDLVYAQAEWLVNRLKPIQQKIVGCLYGNHEDKVLLAYEQDIYERIRVMLNVPALGYYGMVRFSCHREDAPNKDVSALDVFTHHGFGSGTTDGGVVNTLHKLLNLTDAEIAIMGHRHARIHIEPQVYTFCGGKEPYVTTRQRVALCAGSYLQTVVEGVPTYSGKGGMTPRRTGCALVKVCIPERDIRVEF